MQSRNERQWKDNRLVFFFIALCLTVLVFIFWLVVTIYVAYIFFPRVSPYQNMDDVEAAYLSCKAQAPAGFDCVMVPMLVSEQFMREKGYE